MFKVNEVLEDALHCLPRLQVNRMREINKRYRKLIEAQGRHWMPQQVTLKMLSSFKKPLDIDRFTTYTIKYPSPKKESNEVEVLEPKATAKEIVEWRKNPEERFKQRQPQTCCLRTSKNYKNGAHGDLGPCDEFCSPDCWNEKSPDFFEHFVELKDHVTVEEVMTLLSSVNAVHYEVYPEQNRAFTMELIHQFLKDDRIKAAKSLVIEIVAHTPWEILGHFVQSEHWSNYFRSPGNEERVIILKEFQLYLLNEFRSATETKNFARLIYFRGLRHEGEPEYIDHLTATYHEVPLVIENSRVPGKTTIFLIKNKNSGETLVLRSGWQKITMSDRTEQGFWVQFKRLPREHTIEDILYD